ncbi:MAG: GreA/GreB family elongation factor [Rubritalea sp.]|tara:strand:+ start:9625 stop:11442 length:1818 start_codon:yes stop_codon:yes gene_type:complete
MHPDVAILAEAGRISKEVGERLSQLAPGKFCLHKNWGAGKVKTWDLQEGKLVIDFEQNEGQEMGLKFALQRTEVLDEDHFRAQKLESMAELRGLVKEDPVALVVRILKSLGGSLKLDQLERELIGSVIPEKDYKKWWEGAKKALRESRAAVVPTKRTEPLVLRDENLTPGESLVSDFYEAKDLKTKARALEAIIKDFGHVKNDPDVQFKIATDIDSTVRKGLKLHLGQALDLLVGRDDLMEVSDNLVLEDSALRLSDLIQTESGKIGNELGSLPAARQRKVFEAYPVAFGDTWVKEILAIFDIVGPRGLAEIAKLLIEEEKSDYLYVFLRTHITGRTLGADSLLWICRERKKLAEPIFDHEVGNAILSLLERDAMDDGPRKSSRLQTYFMEDKELIPDLLLKADTNEAKNFGRKLHQGQIFPELDRKSLMARVIKAAPATQELVNGADSEQSSNDVVTSWDSIDKRKAEYKDIVDNQIPQNREEIKVAKSHGDLRENAEYHMSKDNQKVLMRRKADHEKALSNVKGTDFADIKPDSVKIGTIVTLDAAGKNKVMTILGAWDSDPDNDVISYLSEMAQSLLGSKVGDTVDVVKKPMTVKAIKAYNA